MKKLNILLISLFQIAAIFLLTTALVKADELDLNTLCLQVKTKHISESQAQDLLNKDYEETESYEVQIDELCGSYK